MADMICPEVYSHELLGKRGQDDLRIGTTNASLRNLIDGVLFDQRHTLHGDASAEQHHSLHGNVDPSHQDMRITYEEFLDEAFEAHSWPLEILEWYKRV
ncbi:hypothetical protein M5K25_008126 [Dendrobium thyrsiflorum]|uniref:Uncharacterized protein n=1 Tax=Dendrobium thyrsiflorum TaxID=117978 RepID=A0ABD0V8L6_DENTH